MSLCCLPRQDLTPAAARNQDLETVVLTGEGLVTSLTDGHHMNYGQDLADEAVVWLRSQEL